MIKKTKNITGILLATSFSIAHANLPISSSIGQCSLGASMPVTAGTNSSGTLTSITLSYHTDNTCGGGSPPQVAWGLGSKTLTSTTAHIFCGSALNEGRKKTPINIPKSIKVVAFAQSGANIASIGGSNGSSAGTCIPLSCGGGNCTTSSPISVQLN